MGGGVWAGTTTPDIVSDACPGRPASPIVITSGSADERFGVVTANARNFPSLTCGTAGVITLKSIVVVLASVDLTAGAAPGNGTATRSRSCECLNISPDKCDVVPIPEW